MLRAATPLLGRLAGDSPLPSKYMPIRKARTSKEKVPETDLVNDAETAEAEKPRRRRAAKAGEEAAEKPVRRRAAAGRRDEDEPEVSADESEDGASPVRPVLTAMPRPVRDDELQEARAEALHNQPAAALAPAPEPESPTITEVDRDGTPMQVIKLNDLKRMKIMDLSKMAHDFGIEGYQVSWTCPRWPMTSASRATRG